MKTTIITLISIAVLGASGAYAQGGPERQGAGYGGPPKTDEERAARQEQCQNGSRPLNGQGKAQNRGQGQCDGQGPGQGPRDGSGFRRGKGNGNRGGNR